MLEEDAHHRRDKMDDGDLFSLDQIDEVRSGLYRLLDFEEEDWSQKKELVKREVLYAINELRISVENL